MDSMRIHSLGPAKRVRVSVRHAPATSIALHAFMALTNLMRENAHSSIVWMDSTEQSAPNSLVSTATPLAALAKAPPSLTV